MRTMTLVGVLLILLGVAAPVYQGISYTSREQVLKIGPVEATKETTKTIAFPPVLGGAALVGGIVLVLLGARR